MVIKEKFICGIDEAGRGPLAGPVVVAAVIFQKGQCINGVKDSKKLTQLKREELFDIIINSCKSYSICEIDNQSIDEINILNSTMLGMQNNLEKLDLTDTKVLIDGNYFKLKEGKEKEYNFETIVKGDEKIFEISAASILAKVHRDRLMQNLDLKYPQYLFRKNKGYGTKEHIEAILSYGLSEVHRVTFCRNLMQTKIFNG